MATKAQLLDLAESNGVEVEASATKADIEAALAEAGVEADSTSDAGDDNLVCANCGEALYLEADGNGSFRYYSGTSDADRSATCTKDDGEPKVKGAHVLAA